MICGFIDFGFLISFLYSDADGKVKISDADRNTPEIHETVLQLMVSLNRFVLTVCVTIEPRLFSSRGPTFSCGVNINLCS